MWVGVRILMCLENFVNRGTWINVLEKQWFGWLGIENQDFRSGIFSEKILYKRDCPREIKRNLKMRRPKNQKAISFWMIYLCGSEVTMKYTGLRNLDSWIKGL